MHDDRFNQEDSHGKESLIFITALSILRVLHVDTHRSGGPHFAQFGEVLYSSISLGFQPAGHRISIISVHKEQSYVYIFIKMSTERSTRACVPSRKQQEIGECGLHAFVLDVG